MIMLVKLDGILVEMSWRYSMRSVDEGTGSIN